MKTILVPTDFSNEAEKALFFALELSASSSAELIVYHAYLKENDSDAERHISSLKKQLEELGRGDVFVVKQLVSNEIGFFSGLWETAKVKSVDLILTATKGIDSYFGIQEESNSSMIIQDAPCPVLTLKSNGLSAVPNILITSEFINGDNDIEFQIVKEIIVLFNSSVTFLYVDQDNKHSVGLKDIERFADKWGIDDYTSQIVGGTTAASAIFEVAKETNSNLVVIGYHKSRVHQHEVYGSLAGDFINHSKYPVLTIHV